MPLQLGNFHAAIKVGGVTLTGVPRPCVRGDAKCWIHMTRTGNPSLDPKSIKRY